MAQNPDIEAAIKAALEAQSAYESAKELRDEAQEKLIASLEANRRKTYTSLIGDHNYRATRVQSSTPVIDEAGLKKELGYRLFNRVTKKVVDRKKLERLMGEGHIDPMIVGKHVTIRESKPHVRISKSEVNPEDEEDSEQG